MLLLLSPCLHHRDMTDQLLASACLYGVIFSASLIEIPPPCPWRAVEGRAKQGLMIDKHIYITSITFLLLKMASLALPGASQANADVWVVSLFDCSVSAGEEKRAAELCNQSADSFKISLGGHGESSTACWESNSAAICNLLPNGNQRRSERGD